MKSITKTADAEAILGPIVLGFLTFIQHERLWEFRRNRHWSVNTTTDIAASHLIRTAAANHCIVGISCSWYENDWKNGKDYADQSIIVVRFSLEKKEAVCRQCCKLYDPNRSRSPWRGYCSQRCSVSKAKSLGHKAGVTPKRSEHAVLSSAGELGTVYEGGERLVLTSIEPPPWHRRIYGPETKEVITSNEFSGPDRASPEPKYNVLLIGAQSGRRIELMREIRNQSGRHIKECGQLVDLVDGAFSPQATKEVLSFPVILSKAEAVGLALNKVGGTVKIIPDGSPFVDTCPPFEFPDLSPDEMKSRLIGHLVKRVDQFFLDSDGGAEGCLNFPDVESLAATFGAYLAAVDG